MLIVVAIIFIVLGSLIKYGKMYNLIAGYNTMSKKEQERYNIEGVATVFKNVMFTMAFILIFGYIFNYWFESERFETFLVIVTLVIGLIYLLLVTNSKTYKINSDDNKSSSDF